MGAWTLGILMFLEPVGRQIAKARSFLFTLGPNLGMASIYLEVKEEPNGPDIR